MAVDLRNHPGLNPKYFSQMETRGYAIWANRESAGLNRIPVPPQPNKYVPHIGAKQRAKGAK
jgi:hypothetical protein